VYCGASPKMAASPHLGNFFSKMCYAFLEVSMAPLASQTPVCAFVRILLVDISTNIAKNIFGASSGASKKCVEKGNFEITFSKQ